MPVQKEQNEKIKEERRRLILSSALKVFTSRGFAASKMNDISREANISYGLLYYYFQSKDEIYAELLKHAADSSRQLAEKIDREPLEPIEKINKMISTILDGIRQKKNTAYYFVLCVSALLSDANPEQTKEITDRILDPLKILEKVIAQGQSKKQIRPGDPKDLAVSGFSMILGLSSLMISGKIQSLPDVGILQRLYQP